MTNQIKGEPFFSPGSINELKQLNGRLELVTLMKVLTAVGVTAAAVEDPLNTAKDLPYFVEGTLNIDPTVRAILWNDISTFLATEGETLSGPETQFWTDLKDELNNPMEWLKKHGKHLEYGPLYDCRKAATCWCGMIHCGAGKAH